ILRSFRIAADEASKIAMPKANAVLLPSENNHALPNKQKRGSFFLETQEKFGELPLFLAGALPQLSALKHLSLRAIFSVRGHPNPFPSLRGALYVLVNRRSKKPQSSSRTPVWKQPLYLLQNRDGSYLCSRCAIEGGRLTVYAYPGGFTRPQPVRRHPDAEIV